MGGDESVAGGEVLSCALGGDVARDAVDGAVGWEVMGIGLADD